MDHINHNGKSLNIIFDIGGVLFDLHKHRRFLLDPSKIQQPLTKDEHIPIAEGIHLLKQCHQARTPTGERRHKLFILSNWNTDNFTLLSSTFPDVFSLFDGIVTSGIVGVKKPHRDIYNYLLTTYDLNPLECIFIDDYAENIQAAQALGITGIECFDHQEVLKKLKHLGVLPTKENV